MLAALVLLVNEAVIYLFNTTSDAGDLVAILFPCIYKLPQFRRDTYHHDLAVPLFFKYSETSKGTL